MATDVERQSTQFDSRGQTQAQRKSEAMLLPGHAEVSGKNQEKQDESNLGYAHATGHGYHRLHDRSLVRGRTRGRNHEGDSDMTKAAHLKSTDPRSLRV